jgi:hypothetical protein
MTLRRFVWPLGLLIACAVPRPEEAYEPLPEVDNDEVTADFVRDAGPPKARPVTSRDAGSGSGSPAQQPSSPGMPVAPGAMKPPEMEPPSVAAPKSPLDALAGYYLMRMDMYSRWETSKPVQTRVRNRISNLLFVQVDVEQGKLVGHETICDQSYQHVCEMGCRSWTTTLNPDVADKFATLPPTPRSYQYAEDTRELRAEMATLSLGFDEVEGQSAIPSSPQDPRVWKLPSGAGVYTLLSAKAVVGQELNCWVSSVQRFPTAFSGKLGQSGLEGEFTLASKVEAVDIDIGGAGTRCTRDTVDGQAPTTTKQVVRLKKVSVAECPANFEQMFPGDAP